MSLFTLTGLGAEFSDAGNTAVSISSSTLEIFVPDTVAETFTYTIDPANTEPFPDVDIQTAATEALLNGVSVIENDNSFSSLGMIEWGTGNSTVVLQLYSPTLSGGEIGSFFVLGGDPLPAFTSVAEFQSFLDGITADGPATGAFAPGSTIAFADLPTAVESPLPVIPPVVLTGSDGDDVLAGDGGDDDLSGGLGNDDLSGGDGDDNLAGGLGNDSLTGGSGSNRLLGEDGNDTLQGGDGNDTLNGGIGDDSIIGGTSSADLRDVVFAGSGRDFVDGGYGNDDLNGMDDDDTLAGGFGVDTVAGGFGNDVITGSAFSDLVFGNDGADFVNGGFGSDRVNGGAGADKFFHVGVAGHGSDWLQDFTNIDGDVLVFGGTGATAADFQVNFANTTGAGDAAVDEAFVIYKPTGQILWALVDGSGEASINLQIGAGSPFDLLA